MAERGKDLSKLDCSICLSAFNDPKILPCFHTFCLQCLDEYVIRNGQAGKFECPLCRVDTEIPVGGVKSFQSNFYIQGSNTSEHNTDCDVCGEGYVATHYCTDCEENFCERCTIYHMKMKVTREHTLIQLKELSDVDTEGHYTRKIQKKYFCPQHKAEEIKMVCKDCNTKLCVVCKLTEHENHNTSSITKEAEERRTSLLKTIASADSQLGVLKSRISISNNSKNYMEKELERNITSLEKRVESVIAKVKQDAASIKQELIKSNTKAKDYYLEKEKQIRGKIMENEAVISHAQNVVELGDDCQMLDAELVSKLQSLTVTEECSIKLHEHLIFEISSSEITDDILGKVSEVSSNVSVKELDELQCSPNTKEANTLSMSAGRLYAAFRDFYKFLYHDSETSKSYFTEWFYDRGACAGLTCIGNDLYFTSLVDKTVYKYQTPEHVKVKFKSFEVYPHGIAHRLVRNGDKEQELLICCLQSGKLLDTDASEGCVIAVSVTNKKQYTWRYKEIPGPTCIATNTFDGTVCLGYPAAHKVTWNASDGTVLSVFSGLGCHGNPETFCPVSVCFDSQYCIIIADYKNGAVIRIDEFGNFLQCLVERKTPLSVLLRDDNILYVGFNRKDITRYQLKLDK
ncbi:tripartite motif-containing protein 45-like [Mercenaria mercenaria]|uniref:tripartite motif-containing protein 45-like n=1 Tax=Mercenaria mercenaria TaxID=6596 RepID=UPI00234F2EF2|nr:tripartite motif-containing protein 45-like [Mercenaria mercenaria]